MGASEVANTRRFVSPWPWHSDDCHLQTHRPRGLIKSAGQWDAWKPKCSCSVVECRLGDGARPLSGWAGWLWAEGTGCRSTLECGPVPTADSHPESPGRGGLSRRLDLESCLFGCLFVVWLKRVAQLAQLLSTKGSCIWTGARQASPRRPAEVSNGCWVRTWALTFSWALQVRAVLGHVCVGGARWPLRGTLLWECLATSWKSTQLCHVVREEFLSQLSLKCYSVGPRRPCWRQWQRWPWK